VRSPRGYAAPALVLLAVTLAVFVLHSTRHTAAPTTPAAKVVVAKKAVAAPGRRWYHVAAGDTLAGIAGKTHVPLATIRTLNPGLQPTALYIGEKIRLR
jgi:LysM repeat protein